MRRFHPSEGKQMTNEEQPITKESARSLRDDIATAALQGMIAAKRDGAMSYERLAVYAYMMADAMLEARKQTRNDKPQDAAKYAAYGMTDLTHLRYDLLDGGANK
jgi:ribosomal protein L13